MSYVTSLHIITPQLHLCPVGLAMVIRQVPAMYRAGAGSYGQLAWLGHLRFPFLCHYHIDVDVLQGSVGRRIFSMLNSSHRPSWLQQLGTMPIPTSRSGRGTHHRGAQWTSSSPMWYYFFNILRSRWSSFFIALGTLEPLDWASKLFFFFSAWIADWCLMTFPMLRPASLHVDGLPPYATGLLHRPASMLPACLIIVTAIVLTISLSLSSIPCSIGTSIFFFFVIGYLIYP